MYRGRNAGAAEAELEALLEQLDAAIDLAGDEDDPGLYWEVWLSLPLRVRDLLLATAPLWWALPAPVFRRLLLTTARLIVWQGMAPLAALRRAGFRLRLPSPRSVPIPRRLLRPNANRGLTGVHQGGPPLRRSPAAGRVLPPFSPRPARRVPAARGRPARRMPRIIRVGRPAALRLGGGRRVRFR